MQGCFLRCSLLENPALELPAVPKSKLPQFFDCQPVGFIDLARVEIVDRDGRSDLTVHSVNAFRYRYRSPGAEKCGAQFHCLMDLFGSQFLGIQVGCSLSHRLKGGAFLLGLVVRHRVLDGGEPSARIGGVERIIRHVHVAVECARQRQQRLGRVAAQEAPRRRVVVARSQGVEADGRQQTVDSGS